MGFNSYTFFLNPIPKKALAKLTSRFVHAAGSTGCGKGPQVPFLQQATVVQAEQVSIDSFPLGCAPGQER